MDYEFQSETKLFSYLEESRKKVYIYGAGVYGDFLGKYLDLNDIRWCGYLDGDESKHGKLLNGKVIRSITSIEKTKSIIIISALPFLNKSSQIYEFIIENGFRDKDIICFSENPEWVRNMLFRVKQPQVYLNKIIELKNIYEGKRCFILGNGPSLLDSDLIKLKSEIVFGCNTIYQLFEKLKMKLSVLLFADNIFHNRHIRNENDFDKIMSLCDYGVTLFTNNLYDKYRDRDFRLYFIENKTVKNKVWFETEVENGFCESGTSLFILMQLAVYMGIKEIYLLGVDFTFQKEMRNGKLTIYNCKNHAEGMDQATEGMYDIDYITQGFLCAREFANANDIKIFNATRGGKLEIFERVDFDCFM